MMRWRWFSIALGLVLFASAGQAADLEFAHGLYRQQRFKLAAEEYAAILSAAGAGTQADEARFYLAESLVQLGERDKALPHYEHLGDRSRRTGRHYRMALFRLGELRLVAGQQGAAEPAFERFLREYPKDNLAARAALYLGEAQLTRGDAAAARKSLDRAAVLDQRGELVAAIRFAQARVADSQNRLADAAKHYAELAQQSGGPLADKARLALAMVRLRQEQFAEANQLAASLLDGKPAKEVRRDALYVVGLSATKLGRWLEAASRLEEYLAADPDPATVPTAVRQMGTALARTEPTAAGRSRLDRLAKHISLRADAAELLLALADQQYGARQFATAAGLYQQALDRRPASAVAAKATLGLGWSQWELQKPEESLRQFTSAAAAADPVLRSEARYMAGLAAHRLGKSAEALRWLVQVATEDGGSRHGRPAAERAIDLTIEAGDRDQADRLYGLLLDRQDNAAERPRLLSERAWLAVDRRQAHQAEQLFRRLVKEHADSAFAGPAAFWLGERAFEAGKAEDAVALFQRSLAGSNPNPNAVRARLRIAQTRLVQKSWQAAYDEADAIARERTDPTLQAEALFVQGRALQQQAKFDEARERYRTAIGGRRDELATKAQFMLAETYFHQRRFDLALKEFLKVEILHDAAPWQAMSLLEIGKCHEQLGEPQLARQAYAKLRERYPQTDAASTARSLLEKLPQR